MNKTMLIIRREYLTRVKKKSFILLTLLMPFIFAALIFVPLALSLIKDGSDKTVYVVDPGDHYAPLFQNGGGWTFSRQPKDDAAFYDKDSGVEAVILINGDPATDDQALQIHSRNQVPADLVAIVENTVGNQVRQDKLAAYGIDSLDRIIADVQKPVHAITMQRDSDGSTKITNADIATAAGFLFTFLIYMFVMSYGAMVMQSVMEEKTNRIVELMVSAVSPFQLMLGKIVGIALVGLTQLAVWVLMLTAILTAAGQMFGTSGTGEATMMLSALMNLPFFEITLLFILFFIGGYLLYASLFAAIGASINAQEDAQQFMTPMIVIMVFAMYAGLYSAENTNGPLAFWSSMFPLTSPIVMMVRIPHGVPLWQELLSLGLLFGTCLACVWISGKIYRIGILLYGKKPNLKEMVKWIRYK
ncbi:MAG: ABC transporter permease [Bacteroidales bacterium]|nr:ABC transporter permease [Bacteroidales bacterium]MCI6251977.1 ABC transporter permease [Bacteroidales bacterium]